LATSLSEIHTKNASKLSFEQLYRHAYKLVLKKKGDLLYEKVLSLEQTWLQDTVQSHVLSMISAALVADISGAATSENVNIRRTEGEKLLKALRQSWEDYILCMSMTTDVLMYMV
jgi:cullin 3